MELLRCPACDGVLNPPEKDASEELRCSSCGRRFTRGHLDSLERQREQTVAPAQHPQPVAIENPDIARRVVVAVLPKPEPALPRGIKIILLVWGTCILVAVFIGCMQFTEQWSWDYLFENVGTALWRGLPLGISVAWSASWLRDDVPHETTAGEAIAQLRRENRKALGRETDENSPASSPKPADQPGDGTDAITRPSSDYQS